MQLLGWFLSGCNDNEGGCTVHKSTFSSTWHNLSLYALVLSNQLSNFFFRYFIMVSEECVTHALPANYCTFVLSIGLRFILNYCQFDQLKTHRCELTFSAKTFSQNQMQVWHTFLTFYCNNKSTPPFQNQFWFFKQSALNLLIIPRRVSNITTRNLE